ncbi:MAG: hypothetical protein K8T25_07775 [Planctomycetia bacterium]|nr:hypothetical protein [Planctomycetia bacterium]
MLVLARHTAGFLLATGLILAASSGGRAQIIADLRGDFVSGEKRGATTQSGSHGEGLPDQGHTGFWNYYTTGAIHPKDWKLDLLTWDKTWRSDKLAENPGYVAAKHRMYIGSITGGKPAIHGEPAPPEGACAMHPSVSPGAVVAEWTSRTSGNIKVAGALQMALDAKQSGVMFMVVKKAADGDVTPLVEPMIINDINHHSYQATTRIAPNDRIYFVLGSNGSPWSDHSHVTARIARVSAVKEVEPPKVEPKTEAKSVPKKEKCDDCDTTPRLFRWRRGR